MEIYIAEPDGDARGAVIVLQEAFGVNEHIRDICDWFVGRPATSRRHPTCSIAAVTRSLGHDDMMAVVPDIMPAPGRRPRSRHRRHARAVGPDGFRARAGRSGRFLHGRNHLVRGRVPSLATRRGGHVLRRRNRGRTLRAPTTPRSRAVVAVPVAGDALGDLDVSIPTVEVEGLREQLAGTVPAAEIVRYPGCGPTVFTATRAARTTKTRPRTLGRGRSCSSTNTSTDLKVREVPRDFIDGAAVEASSTRP